MNLPGKLVSITFDDGLKSVYLYACSSLKAYGQVAILFIISLRILFRWLKKTN
ncbi:MAG: polysaccharide deacetylase family protein [Candidatus Phlomobacter fragariae]